MYTVYWWLMRISGLVEASETRSDRLVQVRVEANNSYIDPAGIHTADELLINLINISLVKIKNWE